MYHQVSVPVDKAIGLIQWVQSLGHDVPELLELDEIKRRHARPPAHDLPAAWNACCFGRHAESMGSCMASRLWRDAQSHELFLSYGERRSASDAEQRRNTKAKLASAGKQGDRGGDAAGDGAHLWLFVCPWCVL